MRQVLETPRLCIRQFTEEDKSIFLDIEQDERLTQYINKRSLEESENLFDSILKAYKKEKSLGRWGVFSNESGEFVGICLLTPSTYDPGYIELGYRLHFKYWGQGLASEIAKALVNYGLNQLQLKEIVAVTDPENIASKKVLLKSGFQLHGEVFWYNEWLPFYKVERQEG